MPDASPRTRLTGAAALLIAVALCVASVGAVLALRRSLLASVDGTARDDAHDVAVQLGRQVPSTSLEPPTPDAAVQVLDADGHVVGRSRNAPSRPVVAVRGTRDAAVTSTGPLPFAGSADAYHVAALRTSDERFTILVALPSDDVTDAVHRLAVVLAVGVPVLFLVLVLLAWVVVGRALAPMDALLKRQREFVSDAAHELRTPLAGVMARLELVESDPALDARRELPRLRVELARLSTLVDGLLALVRASAQRPPESEIDLEDVVGESVRRARDRTSVVVDGSGVQAVRVRGDRVALGQLVDNLLDNGARYATSRVTLTLRAERQVAVLTVGDDGPGIAPADRGRVFGRFTRLDTSRARSDGGVGLGLAIVRAVATAHAGEVSVHDNAPGARFEVRIPLSQPGD